MNAKPDLASGSSLNDAPLAVTVYYGGGVNDKPSSAGGFVYTFGSYTGGNVNYKMQIAWETLTTNTHYIRTCTNNVWSNWEVISQSIPSFYKNYSNLSDLSSAIGVKTYRASTDEAVVTTNVPINAGEGGGTCVVITSSHNDVDDNTQSAIYLIRLGFSNNHATAYEVINRSGNNTQKTLTVSYSGNYLTLSGFRKYLVIQNF